MELRLRLFIDFWNFQLNWNQRTGKAPPDWPKVPLVFLQKARELMATAGSTDSLALHETRVYASYDPGSPKDAKLRAWLDAFLDRQPSFRVFTRERRAHIRPVHCAACGKEFPSCPSCAQPFRLSTEKGVDTAIVTDLLSLAWEGAYEIAILVSSDADFVPAVERLQEKGIKVINATWRGHGHQLARICWASFEIDDLTGGIIRKA
jgi:uncharacterized LabA/DUF88 family protein